MKISSRVFVALLTILSFFFLPLSNAFAQAVADGGDTVIEEIYVTGSLIKQDSFDGVSAVQVVDRSDIEAAGQNTIYDILIDSTITGGMIIGYSPGADGLDAAATAPANLRNLGFGSTLVLMNGRRMPFAASVTGDGATFVDLNTIPAGMIERVEILKTGASATYGSDAAAGVMNVITRTNFNGLDISYDHKAATENDYNEHSVDATWGISSDRGRAVMSISHFERDLLQYRDTEIADRVVFKSTGYRPGAYATALYKRDSGGNIIPGGTKTSGAVPLVDPSCGTIGNEYTSPYQGGTTCRVNSFAEGFFAATTESTRTNAMVTAGWDVNDSIEFYGEGSFMRNKDTRQFLIPSAPGGSFIIPASHPDIPASLATAIVNAGADGLISAGSQRFLQTNSEQNATQTPLFSNTFRLSGGIRGDFTFLNDRDWSYDANITWGEAEGSTLSSSSIMKERFQIAIDGACQPGAAIPDPLIPGNNYECLNMFGDAATAGNSEEFLNSLWRLRTQDYQTALRTYEFYVTGGVMDLAGGELAVAAGYQYREEEWKDIPSILVEQDLIISSQQPRQGFEMERSIDAFFAEVSLPFLEGLDLRVSVRHESPDVGSESTDPRVVASYSPFLNSDSAFSSLKLRGSWGTSFRAPGLNVIAGETSSSVQTSSPRQNGDNIAVLAVKSGNSDLAPEETTSWTIGASLSFDDIPFGDSLDIGFDWWNYDVSNIVGAEDANAIVANLCGIPLITEGTGAACDNSNNNFIFDGLGNITAFRSGFENTASTRTDGLDAYVNWAGTSSWFDWSTTFDLTYINSFELQATPGSGFVNANGNTNQRTPVAGRARTNPEIRANISTNLTRGAHAGSIIMRWTSGLTDDNGPSSGCTFFADGSRDCGDIGSLFKVDARYAYTFDSPFGLGQSTQFYVGVSNLLNKHAPWAKSTWKHANEVHDVRGRTAYGGLKISF